MIDALDEAEDKGLDPKANRLYLPTSLPAGVVIILTSREQMDYRLDVGRREDLYLRDDDPRNLDDVRTYVTNYLRTHPDVRPRVAGWGVPEAEFTGLVAEKSQGNFMYVVRVLGDIQTGLISRSRHRAASRCTGCTTRASRSSSRKRA